MNKVTKTIDLFTAILALKTPTEAQNFFRDLLTATELAEFGKRWEAAQMLEQKVPYTQIEIRTGLSSTTVARVSQWLNSGTGGYKLVLKRLGLHHRNHTP